MAPDEEIQEIHLEVDFICTVPVGYRRQVQRHEWVRGLPVEIVLRLQNLSDLEFPGGILNLRVREHGTGPQSGRRNLAWEPSDIPSISPVASVEIDGFEFLPFQEGLCNLILDIDDVDGLNVQVSTGTVSKRQVAV